MKLLPHGLDPDAYGRLTPRERSVLRLVEPRTKTAVIAGRLGLADGTVETHIKRARSKLGGVSRFDAADLLRAYESTNRLGTQPLEIGEGAVIEPTPASVGPSFDCEDRGDELREQRASFEHAQRAYLRQPAVEIRYRLGSAARIGLIIAMIVGLALTIVAVLNMFGTIDRTLPGRLVTYRTR